MRMEQFFDMEQFSVRIEVTAEEMIIRIVFTFTEASTVESIQTQLWRDSQLMNMINPPGFDRSSRLATGFIRFSFDEQRDNLDTTEGKAGAYCKPHANAKQV